MRNFILIFISVYALSAFGIKAQGMGFIPNKGQVYDQNGNPNTEVVFLHKKGPLQIQLRKTGFSYEVFKKEIEKDSLNVTRLDLSFSYGDNGHRILFNWQGEQVVGENINYYNHLGRFENIRQVSRVIGLSEDGNIKLIFSTSESGSIKYDIWIKTEVADKVRLSGQEGSMLKSSLSLGELYFQFFNDTIVESIPSVYLHNKGSQTIINDAGWIEGESSHMLKLKLPQNSSWQSHEWIVIDPLPILRWATYYGGTGSDFGYGCDAGPDGMAYFCGSSSSTGLATSKAYRTKVGGSDDVFFCKVDRNGGSKSKLYSTYLGGNNKDVAYDIKTLNNGYVLLTGLTNSKWLAKNLKYDSTYESLDDAFIALFNDTGYLEWFNYIGGKGSDIGYGVNVDSSGNFLFVGYTESSSLSTRKSGYNVHDSTYAGNGDVLFGKFSPAGECLFLSYYGGTAKDVGYSICPGIKDTLYLVGETQSSSDISVTNSLVFGIEGFISKFKSNGDHLTSRYFGDSANDITYSVDFYKPHVFITGTTNSKKNIATSGAFRTTLNFSGGATLTEPDAFLAKLNADLKTTWSTYYGGEGKDDARAMVIDDFGYIYLTGTTESSNSPRGFSNVIATNDAFKNKLGGGFDSYVVKFSNTGNRIWGTYFGDSRNDYGYDLAHGKFGDVFFTGATNSDDNIIKNAFQDSLGGSPDAYFADLVYCKKFAIIRKDTVCLNDTFSIKFTDSANKNNWNLKFPKYKFEWTGPNNYKYSFQTARRKAIWKDTGLYQLIVTDSFGCRDTAKIRVNYFHPLPIDTLLSRTSYCQWDTLKFKATAGPWQKSKYKFFWRSLDSVFRSGNNSDTIRYPARKGKSDGKYILRIVDHNGCTSRDTFNIAVGPVVQVSSNTPVCPKDTMVLQAKGLKLRKVVWLGPNGFKDSGLTILRLNASKSMVGKYTAYVLDSNGCKDTLSMNIALFQLDSLLITRNDPICLNQTLSIAASMRSLSGKFTFKWTGPNSFSSSSSSFSISNATLVNKGSYMLQITETASGCTIDSTLTINIRTLPYPHVQTNAPVCEGGRFTIKSNPKGGAGTGYKYSWLTPRSITRTTAELVFDPVVRADSGVYKLKLTDSFGCSKDTSVLFSLKMLPDVNFWTSRDSQCLKNNSFTLNNSSVLTSGSFKNFNWKVKGFNDTLLTNKNSITRKFGSPGTYEVKLIATSNDGCIDSLTKYLGVYPEPTVSWKVTSEDTQCLKWNKFTFDDESSISSGTLQRFWTFGDGGKSSADPATYSYKSVGNFSVKLKIVSGKGCSDSLTKTVRVNDNPKPIISVNSSTQCYNGNSFIFTDVSTISSGWYLKGRKWDVGAGFADTAKKDTVSYSSSGSFTVAMAVTSYDGCADTGKITVTVQSIPTEGAIGSNQTICNGGNPVAFTSTSAGSGSGAITYRWESSTNSGSTWTTIGGANSSTYDVPTGLTTTTQYRRITISTLNGVACESVATTPVTVTVQSVPVAGVIDSNQTICNGGDPAAFTSKTAGSGSGTITYRWESNTNITTPSWSTISGATSDTYDVPAGLSTTTQYRRITISTQNSIVCESATASVTVTVQAAVTAGSIGSNQTICDGGDPAVFTNSSSGTGSGTITYRWESNTNLTTPTWSTITGANGATYDVPAGLTITTQYRRVTVATLNSVTCESVATAAVTVTVQSPVSAGSIGSDQTICNGGNPAAFTNVTNGSGSGTITYRWESNTNITTPSWSTIAGATGDTYDVPPGLTATTQYRRIAISTLNSVACVSASSAVTVTVQSVVSAGAIDSDQTICNGGDPAAFTNKTAGSGSGTITYRWESNTNITTPSWSTITGATGATYDVPAGLTITTQYRRFTISTQNTVACELSTAAVTVTVQNAVTAGTIGSDQTICNGGDPAAFTSSTAGTGSGTITYRWESNTNLTTPSWSTVSGATGATYDVPSGLSTTTQYRRITISKQNNVACESGATSAVTVTVLGTLTSGSIGSNQTICNGGNPASFTSSSGASGSGTITYRWESNTNLTTPSWATVAGATSDTLDIGPGLTTTTQYRRVAISTQNSVVCESATTAVTVTVQSVVTAGVIGSDQTICDGGNPVAFNSTTNGGGSGMITYRWESNTNLTTPSWSIVSGATGATYDVPPGLTTTTQYRRVAISTLNNVVCESGATSALIVRVQIVPTSGAIGSDETICNGGNPAAFTSITNGTGSGTFTYRWESNTNLTTPTWSTITGANGATYDVPAGLTITTQYRRITISTLNSVACESVATSAVTVTVQTSALAGVIASSQTICNGGDPALFTSTTAGSGSGTITYRWESNTNITTPSWSTIAGATSDTYDVPAGLTTTTQYRRITISTQNSVVCEVATSALTATVQNTVTAGTIGSDQTICNGGDPTVFTSSSAATGSGIISYRWESSTNLGSTWSSITGATGATYDVPAGLTTTTQYRRVAISTQNSVQCESVATSAVTVTVQSSATAGAIGSNQTICSGGDPAVFSSTTAGTGSGTISYRWESSINSGTTWSTITGATGATYDVPAGLTTTTQYRRVTISMQNSVACESPTSAVTVTVQTSVNPGVVGSNQTICNGGDPALFTSSTAGSGSGTITYRWESNTNITTPSWSTVTGASGTTYDVPAGLTVTTQYRRIAISTLNSVVCESATATVTVTVQSAVTAGSIAADQTICNGGDPVVFSNTTAGSGSGTISYRWESSINAGTTWSGITGATGATYDVPAGLTTTTQYRRISISTLNTVACESGGTTAVIVTVQTSPTAGAIGSSQTICNGGDPVAFTSTTAGTGSGTISYRWEASTNSGSTWTTISGATTAVYDVPLGLTTTTQYRRITVSTLNSFPCESVATNSVTVTVRSIPTAGAFVSDQTICNGGDPVAFISTTAGTGDGSISYRWESSINLGSTWSTISGATASTYDVPAGLTTTSQYRRITLSTLNSAACESPATSSITVTVQIAPLAGSIGSDQTICSGDDPVAFTSITAGSGSGTISYRWESSINSGTTWSGITGANGATYDVPAGLTVTTQYRRITVSTQNSVLCESVATSAVTVKVNPLPTATAYSNSPVCTRGNLVLKSTGGLTYEWSGPNNFKSKRQDTIALNIDSSFLGNYTVWVTDTNKCKNSFTIDVDVKPGFRVTATSNSDTTPVCTFDPLKLYAKISSFTKSTYSFEWDSKSFFSTLQNPVILKVDSSRDGKYRVIVKSANGCIDTAYTTPSILRPPKLRLLANSPECVGQKDSIYNVYKSAISYLWTKPNGSTETNEKIKINSLKTTDAGKYKLKIVDAKGCRNEDSIVYVVNKLPVLTITGDKQLCTGSTLNMSVTGALNYIWTGPNSFQSFASSFTRIKVGLADSGRYRVIGRDVNGCRDTAYHRVAITPAIPSLKIFGDSQVCLWETLVLTTSTTPKYRYKWRTPNGAIHTTPQLRIGLNDKKRYEGTYSVVVSDSAYNCSDSVAENVWVGPRPMRDSTNSPVCAGDVLKLYAIGNSRWTWDWSGPQGFKSTSTTPQIPYVTANYTGNFRLIGRDTLGCNDTMVRAVKINDCLTLEIFSDSVRCKGDATGKAWVRAFKGSGSYEYKWLTSPVRYGDTLKNIATGKYKVVVTDKITGFVRIDSIWVYEPGANLNATISIDTLVCRDSSTARLRCSVTGGTKFYKYKWNNNAKLDSSVFLKVPAGTHSVIVTDRRGCTDTAEATVVNPARWSFSIGRNNVVCVGERSGTATVSVSGGKPAYFYQWDTVTWTSKTKFVGSSYKSLKAGIYRVLVTDANKCQQWDTVVINQPDSIKIAFRIDNYIRCYGDTSGQISAFVKGGIPAYKYLWNYNNKYTDKTAKNLAAGWYVLRLTDANNCVVRDSILLSQPSDIRTQVAKIDHLKCFQDNSGYAEVKVSGGTTPYYVKWDNGGFTAQDYSMNYMDAGPHWVYVRDFQGCYDTLKLTINQPDSISTLYKRRQNVLCYNGNTGWAEFEFTGGTPPYRYVWENGDTVKRSTKLQSANYWVRTRDANGCAFSDTIELVQPAELVVYAKKTDSVSCFGLSDGMSQIDAVGGIKPYGFWFYTGKDTVRGETLKGVAARQLPFKYDAYVQDANGCIDHSPIYIPQPLKIEVVRRGQKDLVCYGARTASISVSSAGGNGGYTYNWNSLPRQYTPTATNLKAGTYIVTLKDYKGCTDYDTFIIKQPAKNPILSAASEEFCLNRNIELDAYLYEVDSVWWFSPSGQLLSSRYPKYTKLNSALSDAGIYTLLGRDKQGCYDTVKVNVIVHKLPVVNAWIQDKAPFCKSDSITLRASGAVSYDWTGPNNFTSALQNPKINGLRYGMTGTYRVLGTDGNTCQSWDTVELKVENNLSIKADQQVCAGSNLILAGYGAEKYRWAGPKGYSSTLQSPVIQDVEDSLSGAFILYAIDKLGCKDTFTTNVLIYPRPYIKPIANEPVCAGEPLQLYSQGGGNYQYRWSGPLGYTSTAVNPRINTTTAAESGKYMVYAAYQADANNLCRDSSGVKVTVFAIPQSQFMLTPQSKLYLTETEYELHDLSKGAVTWRYYLNNEYWSDKPKTNFVRTEAGSLLIKQVVTSSDWSVYSSGNCMDSSEQVYIIDDKPKIWLPNAFTPNNNSRNDMFYPVTVNITEYRLRIYNRWGQKIFDEVNGKWNGIDKSGLWHPIGAYAVYVTYKDITGLEGEVEGSVTLLR